MVEVILGIEVTKLPEEGVKAIMQKLQERFENYIKKNILKDIVAFEEVLKEHGARINSIGWSIKLIEDEDAIFRKVNSEDKRMEEER